MEVALVYLRYHTVVDDLSQFHQTMGYVEAKQQMLVIVVGDGLQTFSDIFFDLDHLLFDSFVGYPHPEPLFFQEISIFVFIFNQTLMEAHIDCL